MINAKEALDLYEASDAFVQQQFMDKIETDIRAAASAGKRELVCSNKKLCESAEDGVVLEPNVVQGKVIAELKRAKFRAKWEAIGEPEVPKHLQNEIGTGPLYVTWGIRLDW